MAHRFLQDLIGQDHLVRCRDSEIPHTGGRDLEIPYTEELNDLNLIGGELAMILRAVAVLSRLR